MRMFLTLGVTGLALMSTVGGPTTAFANDLLYNLDQASKSANPLKWVRYTDPAEGAFSMDIPVGWQIQGGMFRFGYFDVRWRWTRAPSTPRQSCGFSM